MRTIVYAALLALACVATVRGAALTWTPNAGTCSTNQIWSNVDCWSGGVSAGGPGAGDGVIINDAGTVVLDASAAAGPLTGMTVALSVAGAVTFSGPNALTVAGDIVVDESVTVLTVSLTSGLTMTGTTQILQLTPATRVVVTAGASIVADTPGEVYFGSTTTAIEVSVATGAKVQIGGTPTNVRLYVNTWTFPNDGAGQFISNAKASNQYLLYPPTTMTNAPLGFEFHGQGLAKVQLLGPSEPQGTIRNLVLDSADLLIPDGNGIVLVNGKYDNTATPVHTPVITTAGGSIEFQDMRMDAGGKALSVTATAGNPSVTCNSATGANFDTSATVTFTCTGSGSVGLNNNFELPGDKGTLVLGGSCSGGFLIGTITQAGGTIQFAGASRWNTANSIASATPAVQFAANAAITLTSNVANNIPAPVTFLGATNTATFTGALNLVCTSPCLTFSGLVGYAVGADTHVVTFSSTIRVAFKARWLLRGNLVFNSGVIVTGTGGLGANNDIVYSGSTPTTVTFTGTGTGPKSAGVAADGLAIEFSDTNQQVKFVSGATADPNLLLLGSGNNGNAVFQATDVSSTVFPASLADVLMVTFTGVCTCTGAYPTALDAANGITYNAASLTHSGAWTLQSIVPHTFTGITTLTSTAQTVTLAGTNGVTLSGAGNGLTISGGLLTIPAATTGSSWHITNGFVLTVTGTGSRFLCNSAATFNVDFGTSAGVLALLSSAQMPWTTGTLALAGSLQVGAGTSFGLTNAITGTGTITVTGGTASLSAATSTAAGISLAVADTATLALGANTLSIGSIAPQTTGTRTITTTGGDVIIASATPSAWAGAVTLVFSGTGGRMHGSSGSGFALSTGAVVRATGGASLGVSAATGSGDGFAISTADTAHIEIGASSSIGAVAVTGTGSAVWFTGTGASIDGTTAAGNAGFLLKTGSTVSVSRSNAAGTAWGLVALEATTTLTVSSGVASFYKAFTAAAASSVLALNNAGATIGTSTGTTVVRAVTTAGAANTLKIGVTGDGTNKFVVSGNSFTVTGSAPIAISGDNGFQVTGASGSFVVSDAAATLSAALQVDSPATATLGCTVSAAITGTGAAALDGASVTVGVAATITVSSLTGPTGTATTTVALQNGEVINWLTGTVLSGLNVAGATLSVTGSGTLSIGGATTTKLTANGGATIRVTNTGAQTFATTATYVGSGGGGFSFIGSGGNMNIGAATFVDDVATPSTSTTLTLNGVVVGATAVIPSTYIVSTAGAASVALEAITGALIKRLSVGAATLTLTAATSGSSDGALTATAFQTAATSTVVWAGAGTTKLVLTTSGAQLTTGAALTTTFDGVFVTVAGGSATLSAVVQDGDINYIAFKSTGAGLSTTANLNVVYAGASSAAAPLRFTQVDGHGRVTFKGTADLTFTTATALGVVRFETCVAGTNLYTHGTVTVAAPASCADFCAPTSPCLNGGLCRVDETTISTGSCVCVGAFTGATCNIAISTAVSSSAAQSSSAMQSSSAAQSSTGAAGGGASSSTASGPVPGVCTGTVAPVAIGNIRITLYFAAPLSSVASLPSFFAQLKAQLAIQYKAASSRFVPICATSMDVTVNQAVSPITSGRSLARALRLGMTAQAQVPGFAVYVDLTGGTTNTDISVFALADAIGAAPPIGAANVPAANGQPPTQTCPGGTVASTCYQGAAASGDGDSDPVVPLWAIFVIVVGGGLLIWGLLMFCCVCLSPTCGGPRGDGAGKSGGASGASGSRGSDDDEAPCCTCCGGKGNQRESLGTEFANANVGAASRPPASANAGPVVVPATADLYSAVNATASPAPADPLMQHTITAPSPYPAMDPALTGVVNPAAVSVTIDAGAAPAALPASDLHAAAAAQPAVAAEPAQPISASFAAAAMPQMISADAVAASVTTPRAADGSAPAPAGPPVV